MDITKKDLIIIFLNDCVLKADSETGSFMGNACFNFLNSEQEIKDQLKINMVEDFKTDLNFNIVDSERNYNQITI